MLTSLTQTYTQRQLDFGITLHGIAMIDLPNPIGFNQPVRGDAFNKLIEAVRRSRPLPSSSIKVSQSSRGTLLEIVQTEQVSSNVSKSSDENMHPYKLHVFREEYTDSSTGEKTYQYYCGCYIPNGSCVVNGEVSQLRNTAKVSSLVDVDRLSDSDKSLLEDYANDWYSLSPTSDGSIYVHVLEEKGIYDESGEVYSDDSSYIVTNSATTPFTAGDTSVDGATIKRIKWTFRVGSFSTQQDGAVSVSSQVLNTALMLSSGNNGKNGGYYIPHVDASGNLSFTPSDTGSMPDITGNWNIKGDTGATGATGPVGPTGAGMTGGDWSRLEDAINAATGAAGQANGAASNADSSAASANSAAQSASNAATTATSAATAASNAAQNAINAADNASAAAERADQSSQLSESQAQQVQSAIALAQAAAEAAIKAASDALDAAEEASNAVGPTGPTGDSGGVLLAESVETFAIDKNGDWSTFQPEGN